MYKLISLLVLPCLAFAYPPRWGADPFSPLGPWTKRGPPCGLPRFIDKLPETYKEKVKVIWSTYKEGEECDKQHRETRKLVHTLPEEIRDAIFAGKCGPSFLRNVSKAIKMEFRAVWFDHKMGLDEKETALKKLAYALLNGEALALFNKWEEELQIRKIELSERVAALSPDAKQAYDTWKRIRQEERNFLGNLPKEVREELKTLCGWHQTKKQLPTSTQMATTTTEEPSTTSLSISSTTPPPIVEETQKEKEFRVFLDVQMPDDLATEAECSLYL
ncbi:unnamed protein product, partial [Mesorhabditis belari]|uniref:Uncharacterized protein n=1 Tax=Mesorhabditis belari TaxID=2138241 RepID=A0AAF3ERT6_9BILA